MCDGSHQRVGGSRRRIGFLFSREIEKLLMFLIDVFLCSSSQVSCSDVT